MRYNVEQMEKEEKELEQLIASKRGQELTTPDPEAGTEEHEQDEPAKDKELVTPDPSPQPDPSPEPEREDWEKRYKNLRAARDEKLWKSQQQLADAMERVQSLQSKVRELEAKQQESVDPFAGIFTEEDEDTLGPTTLETMKKVTKKATEAATAPLKKQLEEEQKKRIDADKLMVENLRKENYKVFIGKIASAEPDWEAINYDPGFHKFMDEPDYDGVPRKTYFAEAEVQGNAALIVRYMKEYKQGVVPKKDKLASKVAPTGDRAGTNSTPTEKPPEIISRAYIDKFYTDLTKGKYKGKHSEAKAIEDAIDKAVMEGRVR
jgi:hypothetical protein